MRLHSVPADSLVGACGMPPRTLTDDSSPSTARPATAASSPWSTIRRTRIGNSLLGKAKLHTLVRKRDVCVRVQRTQRGSYLVSFPTNDAEMLAQVQSSVQQALSDGLAFLEVEIPLTGRTGDSIAITELNQNMQSMRSFCEVFEWLDQAERVRVFFPDAGERDIAVRGTGINPATGQWSQEPVWHTWPGPLDYLTNDNLLSSLSYKAQGYGDTIPDVFGGKKSVADNVELGDLLYVIGYPYEDYEECLKVMELSETAGRRTIIFNGDLDKVRGAFAPWGRMKKLKNDFIPRFEAAYYVHVFKNREPGLLFRAYPGPWQVLMMQRGGGYKCVAEFEERPTLSEIAREYFSGALATQALSTEVSDEVLATVPDDSDLLPVLGFLPDALPNHSELRAAYRAKAAVLHPDAGGDPEEFAEINRAYSLLRAAMPRDGSTDAEA
mmetsp:Transcript_7709/g.21928  ORF Transcript_7709/g.21928 Transcript_7709/m.21928 type:complete len:439 (+) Transcript_7709:352-1668(+)